MAGANNFSLQLNTNLFNSSLCDTSNCKAWQQYIYDSPGNVYIQYWLLNHSSNCPSVTIAGNSWSYYNGSSGGTPGCYINGNQVSPSTPQAIANLAKLQLTGNNSSSQQYAKLEDANGSLWGSPDSGDLLGVGTQWTAAEFNVVGWGDGSTATLTPNPGTAVVVRTSVDNGTTNFPGYTGGFTGKSNSLTLFPPLVPSATPALCREVPFQPSCSRRATLPA